MPLDDKIFVVVSWNVPFVARPPDVQRYGRCAVGLRLSLDSDA
jgi:hypothetical protein